MFKVFMAGQEVPEWLFKLSAWETNKKYVRPKFTFNFPTVVYIKNKQYQIKAILSPRVNNSAVLKLVDGENVKVEGQSPAGSKKGVIINMAPVLSYFELSLLAVIAACLFYIFK